MPIEKIDIDKNKLFPAFTTIYNFLENSQILKYCTVFYGTLLGFIRDYDFIEGDDDIDFIVSKQYYNLFLNTFNSSDLKINISSRENYFIQIFIPVGDSNIPCDFYFYDYNKEQNTIYVCWENKNYPYDSIFPTKTNFFYNFELNFPNNPINIFKLEYGNSYLIPIKKVEGNKFILKNKYITDILSDYLNNYQLKPFELFAINNSSIVSLTNFLPNLDIIVNLIPFNPTLFILKSFNTFQIVDKVTSFEIPKIIQKLPILNNLIFKDLTYKTLPHIAHLHTKTWIDNYADIFNPKFLEYDTLYKNRLSDWSNRIKNTNNITKIVYIHEIPIGFFHIIPNSNNIYISDFHVIDALKRNYIGMFMFYEIFNLFKFTNKSVINLSVYQGIPAINFYQSLGFMITKKDTITCIEGSQNVSITMTNTKSSLRENIYKFF
jgi:hypothetical protein